ncbi:MAG: pentapeptide repeat-containing protein [Hyphomicrobiaceae bacterium]
MSTVKATNGVPVEETPVNPYSLLEAVNRSSDTSHTAWLIFIAIMSYLLIAFAGVSHKDLLLSREIPLPVLQVQIDLTRFFLFAPLVIVLFHVGVVSQLVMLARKTLAFDQAIGALEPTHERTHPLRLELHNFFFVQGIAGPERSRVMGIFLHGMTWLTLVFVPVLLLLYIQVVFLPYHDVFITGMHRLALTCDIVLLIMIGVFLIRSEVSFFEAFGKMTLAHPISFAVTSALLIVVGLFSYLVATIPDEWLDRQSRTIWGAARGNALAPQRAAYGFVMPFVGHSADGKLFGIFERNLNVTDLDLVVDRDVTPGEPTLILRGRNLRHARLDRTDMHQADLTGADLDGASFIGADLRGALMQCADINELLLSENRRAARCASARQADFTRARLSDARMAGVDMSEARLEDTDLTSADLSYAKLVATSFYGAHLEKADLTGGVQLYVANFATASLQGADLTGSRLYGADFTSAGLQGAILAHTALYGANLRDADLEGAEFYKARLQGTNLAGARIRATSLREAQIWLTNPPAATQAELADLSEAVLRPIAADVAGDVDEQVKRIANPLIRARVAEALAPLFSRGGAATTWNGAAQGQAWAAMSRSQTTAQSGDAGPRLTAYLGDLGCKPRWSNGSVATGIARRAMGLAFRGDAAALYSRFKQEACPAAGTISQRVLKRLGALVDQAERR